jgi:hypothetical protein
MLDRVRRPSDKEKRTVAVIGDMVGSRSFQGPQRRDLQRHLRAVLQRSNQSYARAILARFVITTGDEFQGLLADPTVLPDLVWSLEERLPEIAIRLGIGCGTLETPLAKDAVGMDGPVWHNARAAIMQAERQRRLGGVFEGFGEPDQTVLNGIALLMRHIREGLTRRQLEVVSALRRQPSQRAVAELEGLTPQAISKHARSAGWEAYRAGEAAWRAALSRFDFSRQWRRRN